MAIGREGDRRPRPHRRGARRGSISDRAYAERTCDLVIGSLLLIASMPALVIVAIAIKATSPGPILFRQQRIGKAGKPFVVYKLRTMTNDDRDHASYRVESKGGRSALQARGRPPYHPVGRFLRRSSIDELPQLWNVLRGDMALVGPRPSWPPSPPASTGPPSVASRSDPASPGSGRSPVGAI